MAVTEGYYLTLDSMGKCTI